MLGEVRPHPDNIWRRMSMSMSQRILPKDQSCSRCSGDVNTQAENQQPQKSQNLKWTIGGKDFLGR